VLTGLPDRARETAPVRAPEGDQPVRLEHREQSVAGRAAAVQVDGDVRSRAGPPDRLELAGSQQFAACKVKQVFQTVCFRTPTSTQDIGAAATIASSFQSGYNLKTVFQQVAAACPGT